MEQEKLIYLAIPYSWNSTKSFELANEIAANLMMDGHIVFSPISHSHSIANYMDKISRINSFTQQGVCNVKDESIEDTLIDLANYSILMAGYIKSKKQENGRQ